MWSDFSGKAYSRADFAARLASLKWTDWKPKGITLHNTAAPTLAQWVEFGAAHDARIRNLQAYYEGLGWHGGPHWFISRDWINEFSNPLRRGTHSPSFNATHLGIEMVGDFDREPFNSGDGAKVRDNAVYVMALLCRKFGFNPDIDIKLHKEDPKTTHACPGKFVVKADVIARVKAVMAGQPLPPSRSDGAPEPPPKWKAPDHPAFKDGVRFTGITATVFGGKGDEQTGAYGDFDPNKPGVALPCRIPAPRPKVRVTYQGRSVVCDVIDVGPWNVSDPYWQTGKRPQAESGRDIRGRPTNLAGIDLTPAAAKAIGLQGKGLVDWEFVGAANLPGPVPASKPKEPTKEAAKHGILAGIAATLGLIGAWLMDHPLLAVLAVAALVAALAFGWRWYRNRKKNEPAAHLEVKDGTSDDSVPALVLSDERADAVGMEAVRQALAVKPEKPSSRRKPAKRRHAKANKRKSVKRKARA